MLYALSVLSCYIEYSFCFSAWTRRRWCTIGSGWERRTHLTLRVGNFQAKMAPAIPDSQMGVVLALLGGGYTGWVLLFKIVISARKVLLMDNLHYVYRSTHNILTTLTSFNGSETLFDNFINYILWISHSGGTFRLFIIPYKYMYSFFDFILYFFLLSLLGLHFISF